METYISLLIIAKKNAQKYKTGLDRKMTLTHENIRTTTKEHVKFINILVLTFHKGRIDRCYL